MVDFIYVLLHACAACMCCYGLGQQVFGVQEEILCMWITFIYWYLFSNILVLVFQHVCVDMFWCNINVQCCMVVQLKYAATHWWIVQMLPSQNLSLGVTCWCYIL